MWQQRQQHPYLDMARYGAENDQMCFLCFHVFCVFLTKKSFVLIDKKIILSYIWDYNVVFGTKSGAYSTTRGTKCVLRGKADPLWSPPDPSRPPLNPPDTPRNYY